ncbi:MAG: cyclodeaminase/cyclohydrolase family protein, partial [Pseudomonadota bacterium]
MKEVALQAAALSNELAALVEQDANAYAVVSTAYKLPKEPEDAAAARSARITAALLGAAEKALADIAAGQGRDSLPEVFILQDDGQNPSATLRLLSELKSHQATRHSAVCVVGPAGEGDEAAMA